MCKGGREGGREGEREGGREGGREKEGIKEGRTSLFVAYHDESCCIMTGC